MKYYEEVAKLLEMSVDEVETNSKEMPEDGVVRFWQPIRGGLSVIVDKNGSYLSFSSTISLERAMEEFQGGKRSGSFAGDAEIDKR